MINLLQNSIGKIDSGYFPASLRRCRCQRVIEVLIVGLEKPKVDFVQAIVEYLLGELMHSDT